MQSPLFFVTIIAVAMAGCSPDGRSPAESNRGVGTVAVGSDAAQLEVAKARASSAEKRLAAARTAAETLELRLKDLQQKIGQLRVQPIGSTNVVKSTTISDVDTAAVAVAGAHAQLQAALSE